MTKTITAKTNSAPSAKVILEKGQDQSQKNNSIQELLLSEELSPDVIRAFVEKIYEIKQLGPKQQDKAMSALGKQDRWSLVKDIENAIASDKKKHLSDFKRLLAQEKSDVIKRVQNLWEAKKGLDILFDDNGIATQQNTAEIAKKLQKNPAMPKAFAEVLVDKISDINEIKDPTKRANELLKFSDRAASLTNQHKGYMSVLVKDVSRKLIEDDNTKLLAELIPETQVWSLINLTKIINDINQHFHDKPQERTKALNQEAQNFISLFIKVLPPKSLPEREFKLEYQRLAGEMKRINDLPEGKRDSEFEKLEKEAAEKFIPLPARENFDPFIQKYKDIATRTRIPKNVQQEIKIEHQKHTKKITEHRNTQEYKNQLKNHQDEVRKAIMKVAERRDIKADSLLSSINNIIQLMLAKIDAKLHLTSLKEEKTNKWVNKVRDERKKTPKTRTV